MTDGEYFKVGGTSKAAAVVSGEVAPLLDAHPGWTPNQVKAQIVKRSRPVYASSSSSLVDASGNPVDPAATIESTIVGGEAAADKAILRTRPVTPPTPA